MRGTKLYKSVMIFALLCAASAVAASSAQAWTTNAGSGGSLFTATAPASLLVINTSPAVGLNCTGSVAPGNRATGRLIPMTNSAGTPKILVDQLSLGWTGCTIAGFEANVICQPTATLWGNGPAAIGNPGTVNGEVRNISCSVTVPAFPGCKVTITGNGPNGRGVFGDYNNPAGPAPAATVIVGLANQSLNTTWTTQCTFLPAGGSATANIRTKGGTALPFTVTSAFKPIVTNP